MGKEVEDIIEAKEIAGGNGAQLPDNSPPVDSTTPANKVIFNEDAFKVYKGESTEKSVPTTKEVADEVKRSLKEEEEKASKESETKNEPQAKEVVSETILPFEETARRFLPEKKESNTAQPAVIPAAESSYINEEVATPFYKKMSSDAQEWVKAEFKRAANLRDEYESLKKSSLEKPKDIPPPASWYEHDDGFVLDKTYQNQVAVVQNINKALGHYEQQLIRIKEGERDWEDFTFDQTGNLALIKRNADTRSDVEINRKLAELTNAKLQSEGQAREYQTNFKAKAYKVKSDVRALEDSYFPQFKDDKSYESNKYLKEISADLKTRGLENTLFFGMVSKMYATYRETIEEYYKLKDTVKGKKLSDAIMNSAGVPSDSIQTTGGKIQSKDPNKQVYDEKLFSEYFKEKGIIPS